MPELPEIEVLKKEIEPKIIGKKITSLFSSDLKLRKKIPDLNQLNDEIIEKIDRLNKYIIIQTQKYQLIIHLGMTGKLIVGSELIRKKHTHIILKASNIYITYEDARRFGIIDLIPKTEQIRSYSLFKNIGIDPIQDDYNFKSFCEIVKNKDKNIKAFLLDQSKICGIGNIYANEILFYSYISPNRNINTLSQKELKSLFLNIKIVLEKAISLGGSSISDYVHSDGTKGQMQNHYYVYGRNKELCKQCASEILSIKQNGRSTFYCASCQK